MRHPICQHEINFQAVKHTVEERSVSRMRGIDILACLALLPGGSGLMVAAQSWNRPIP